MKKKIPFRQAIKKADRQFSLFIRLRDSGADGFGNCITCNKTKHYKEQDAGHFIKRQHLRTRFDEDNVNMQCKYCNCFEQGANEKYKVALDEKYGKGTADRLEMKKKMRGKLTTLDCLLLEKYYKLKIKELLKEKNFTV